ncbi:hypothetical protein ACFWU1_38045, partial [Streptomyces sp. NPDC058623]
MSSPGGAPSPMVRGRVVDAAPTARALHTYASSLASALPAVAGLGAALFPRPERDGRRLGVRIPSRPPWSPLREPARRPARVGRPRTVPP